MNGKRAKEFRRLVKSLPDLPEKEYNSEVVKKELQRVDGVLKEVDKITITLKPHCMRAWYKSMKKAAKRKV